MFDSIEKCGNNKSAGFQTPNVITEYKNNI